MVVTLKKRKEFISVTSRPVVIDDAMTIRVIIITIAIACKSLKKCPQALKAMLYREKGVRITNPMIQYCILNTYQY